uniref:Uncharacterized protein n=1 Tax=Photinus pyralis TaxID=7054 RepID=A0A1Y1K9F1_PHOPY
MSKVTPKISIFINDYMYKPGHATGMYSDMKDRNYPYLVDMAKETETFKSRVIYTSPFTTSTNSCVSAFALSSSSIFLKSEALNISTNRAPRQSHITLMVVRNRSSSQSTANIIEI